MEGNVERDDEPPVFAAELTPYRSLGRQGYRVLLGLTGAICLLHGLFFLTTGAWPIVFFFGLDFMLLWGAFWLNYRAGRAREEVTVSRTDVGAFLNPDDRESFAKAFRGALATVKQRI